MDNLLIHSLGYSPPQKLTYISLFTKQCDGWRQK